MTIAQNIPNSDVEAENVYALVVGIEDYQSEKVTNLNGPARDALKYVKWLLDRKVPPENIQLFLSPLAQNYDEIVVELGALNPSLNDKRAAQVNIRNGIDQLRQKAAQSNVLHVFWAGHGFITKTNDTRRRLFYWDTTPENPKNLDLDSLLDALRTSKSGKVFSRQFFLIDACANLIYRDFYPTLDAEAIADKFVTSGTQSASQQYALFAAADYQTAINNADIGTGRFSQAIFSAIKDSSLLINMEKIAQLLNVSEVENQDYKPVFWSFEVGGGTRREYDCISREENLEGESPPSSPITSLSLRDRLEVERLQQELSDREADYRGVSNQLREEQDIPTQRKLQRQLESVGRDIDAIEQKLTELGFNS